MTAKSDTASRLSPATLAATMRTSGKITTNYDSACNTYLANERAFRFSGWPGLANVLNALDYANLAAGMLGTMHVLCNAC
ncbi:hypothetical protein L596_020708 [Steinernema carpocapsae]|uniref:Uncharacterized protein n=1 Tax=Steinernema carpocapsae TaxID=34508 RepID=A0A4V6A0Z3_STECR|nr:hypothetical protein L596_020708 [Steinernema carpocapsae]